MSRPAIAAILAAALVPLSCGGGRVPPGAAGEATSGCRPGQAAAVRGETVKVSVDGHKRSYLLDVPAGDSSVRRPVVIVFHGIGGSAAEMREWTRMGDEAHARGFVAVHPQGRMVSLRGMIGKGWQIAEDDDRDVRLVEEIVDQLDRTSCIDRSRVHAAGFSNGGFFVHFLACRQGGRIAGIGAVAGGLDGIEAVCGPDVRVPAILINGDADPLVPAGTGAMEFWAGRNGCTVDMPPSADGCIGRTGCEGGADVVYCEVPGMGHDWPAAPIDATGAILDFLLDRPTQK